MNKKKYIAPRLEVVNLSVDKAMLTYTSTNASSSAPAGWLLLIDDRSGYGIANGDGNELTWE